GLAGMGEREQLPSNGQRSTDHVQYTAEAPVWGRGSEERDMIPVSKMAAAVQPSATLAAGAKARMLKAEGVHVYDFSLGEPDFVTPEHICRAATKAMLDGHTHYTPAPGILELRSAITRLYQKTYGLRYTPDQVIVSNGVKHSIYNSLAAMCGPGDEVIIPA